jgi:hypothetical protein
MYGYQQTLGDADRFIFLTFSFEHTWKVDLNKCEQVTVSETEH